MDQFTREVDEEYRRSQMAAMWKRYGTLATVTAVLVVLAVAGWKFWESRQNQAAEEASLRFYEAGQLVAENRFDDARTLLAQAAQDASGAPAILARLRLASLTVEADRAEGVVAFRALADDDSAPAVMRDLARLRAAMLQIDSEPDAALPVLQSLAAGSGAFRHTAREQLGLAALRRDDYDGAAEWFDRIAVDPETPGALTQRLEIYSALVASGPIAGSR